MAKLFFKYGAMNCGKSTRLMQEAHNYEEKGMKVLVLKPMIDKKAENRISSRIGIERVVDYLINDNNSLITYLDEIDDISCIFVDEAQFLNEEEVDALFFFAKEKNVPVICYGLKTDFTSHVFPGSKRLFELADTLEELKTICFCGRAARFNARKIAGEFTLSGNQVAIDGIDAEYESLCADCYIKKVLKRQIV